MPQYTVPVTPKELGFSGEDYPYWREHQAAAIERILNSPAKLIIVSAPTGSGKSPIALGCARVLFKDGKRTTIVTSSKELQRQYLDYTFPTDEYDDGQPITATGRSNNPCIRADAEPGTTAANGICVEGKPCEYMGDRETGLKAECFGAGTRVLTEDLQWVPIETIRAGDRISAITDESTVRERRVFKSAKVLNIFKRKAKVIKVTFSDGDSFIVTPEHRVLDSNSNWAPIGSRKLKKVIKPLSPWDEHRDYDAGWLA